MYSRSAAQEGSTSLEPVQADEVGKVRTFNRWYSTMLADLNEQLADTEYSLTEVRVLFALYTGGRATPTALCRALRLDGGYLSRILRRFEGEGLLERSRSDTDGRQRELSLTGNGTAKARALYARADDVLVGQLEQLDPDQRRDLTAAMGTIRSILQQPWDSQPPDAPAAVDRQHLTGDVRRQR